MLVRAGRSRSTAAQTGGARASQPADGRAPRHHLRETASQPADDRPPIRWVIPVRTWSQPSLDRRRVTPEAAHRIGTESAAAFGSRRVFMARPPTPKPDSMPTPDLVNESVPNR